MPSHPIVNRRNINTLEPKTLMVSHDTHNDIGSLAKYLHVSRGSLTDTALKLLTEMSIDEILTAMVHHGHLTADERSEVHKRLDNSDPAT